MEFSHLSFFFFSSCFSLWCKYFIVVAPRFLFFSCGAILYLHGYGLVLRNVAWLSLPEETTNVGCRGEEWERWMRWNGWYVACDLYKESFRSLWYFVSVDSCQCWCGGVSWCIRLLCLCSRHFLCASESSVSIKVPHLVRSFVVRIGVHFWAGQAQV